MVKLPSLEWFMGNINFRGKGNRYSGSFGCNPELGNNDESTFRYSVWIDRNEDEELVLIAGYYAGAFSYEATDKSLITEKTFSVNSEGILDAQNFIESAAEKFYSEKNGADKND